jgi:hypothetical protein
MLYHEVRLNLKCDLEYRKCSDLENTESINTDTDIEAGLFSHKYPDIDD